MRAYQLLIFGPRNGGATSDFVKPLWALQNSAVGWRRSIRAVGGFWQGSFYLTSEQMGASALRNAFDNWLAFHVEERLGSAVTWEGLVYELELTHEGVRQRRSLDLVQNAARTTYVTLDYVGDDPTKNESFEAAGAGAPDVLAGWYENPGASGAIAQAATAAPAGGSYCLALTAGSGDADNDPDTWVRQNFTVTPGEVYQVAFWARGDGSANSSPRFAIRDPNASQWILSVQPCGPAAATWQQRKIPGVVGPSDGELLLFFYAPNTSGRTGYVDLVEVRERTETVYELPWAVGASSVARYGRKEMLLRLDDYPMSTAEAYRDTYLAGNAWPWPRPVAIGARGKTVLEVKVCGYVFTANWLYQVAGDGTEADISTWIAAMAGSSWGLSNAHGGTVDAAGDMEFLKAGTIRTNTLQRRQAVESYSRPWDIIQELVALGDASGAPWRAWVGPGRLLHYGPVDVAPRYYLRGGGIYERVGARSQASPWAMQPAVFRDMSYSPTVAEPGSFLDFRNDLWVEEVEMADGWDRPSLKTALFDEGEILDAQLAWVLGQGPEPPAPAGTGRPSVTPLPWGS